MPLMIRAAHDKTICMFDLAVSLWVIDGSIIELDAHVFAPEFYLIGREVRAVISDDAVGDAVTVYVGVKTGGSRVGGPELCV